MNKHSNHTGNYSYQVVEQYNSPMPVVFTTFGTLEEAIKYRANIDFTYGPRVVIHQINNVTGERSYMG